MEPHLHGDETKGWFYSFMQDYTEAREASRILEVTTKQPGPGSPAARKPGGPGAGLKEG
jgi:hypothetical protein